MYLQIRKIKSILFLLFVIPGWAQDISDTPDEEMGDVAFIRQYTNAQMPSFDFVDIEGNRIRLSDLIGKKVHINFWSTTCKPCIQEFVELNELKTKYEKQGFVFLSFAPESEKKVLKVLSKHQLDYPVIAEAKLFYKQLGIDGYPRNFFIDEAGIIVKVTDGARMTAEFQEGKLVMKPDNYDRYDQIMAAM